MVQVGLCIDTGNRFRPIAFLRLGPDDPHRNRDSIAALRQRLDIVLALSRHPKFAAQEEDVLGEISFLDITIGPDRFNQLLLTDNLPVVLISIKSVLSALGAIGTTFPSTERTNCSGLSI